MRRSRRGSHGMEFGGSSEDSFVAVVVTKLTGALLFILLLTMVIMALLPKAIDLPSSPSSAEDVPLKVTTPETLPEAIAGRPYELALAADGGSGHRQWTLVGALPKGLAFVPDQGLIRGVPQEGTPEPLSLTIAVADGHSRATQTTRLVVYRPESSLGLPSKWKPALPTVPWAEWLDHGFGFLVLWLVYLVGLNVLDTFKRRAIDRAGETDEESRLTARRFAAYKIVLSVAALAASAVLVVWLVRGR